LPHIFSLLTERREAITPSNTLELVPYRFVITLEGPDNTPKTPRCQFHPLVFTSLRKNSTLEAANLARRTATVTG